MTKLSALIFDVDGTLSETEEVHRMAFNEAFAAAGLPWHWTQDMYVRLLKVTGGKERIAHYLTWDGVSERLAADDIAALHKDKTARYTARVAQGGLALRPGVRRLLDEAQAAGLRLALATTTSHPNVDALLAACAPVPKFDVIAAGDDVPNKKPAPDVFTLALERLGVPPEACLAIEDTQNGVNSAVGAGLRCLVTVSAYGGRGPFPGAIAVVSDLGEVGTPCSGLFGPAPTGGVVDIAYLGSLPH
jgi:HAD superfamily hydrolase (TIGR01509 family)